MEFHEKLQELRKNRGLTQEELAEVLYVSRTAISKWESGRGYPSIDSLKEISNYFSVSIDDLLSGEKLLSIAEKENKSNIRTICDLLFGMVGVVKILLTKLEIKKSHKMVTGISMLLNILMVLFLAMAREAYAIMLAFMLLLIKGGLLLKYIK